MRKISLGLVILVISGILTVAQSSSPSREKTAEQLDLDAAKKVAAKALAHFGKTLDLRLVHRDLYVMDGEMRRSVMRSALYEAEVDTKTVDQLDRATLERAFLAVENLSWLMWSYAYQENKDLRFEDFVSTIRPRVWPKLNISQKKLFQRMWNSPDDKTPEPEKISKRELLDWIAMAEILARELQRLMPADLMMNFSTNVQISVYPEGLKNRETYYASAQIKGIWGKYTFKMVREKGVMRIVSFIIHDGPG